jgi:uroporphyrinogen decarboxylase
MMTTGTVPGNAMTHRERIQATLRGEAVDRPPVSLWRHFPREDETVEGLVKATVRFQREYDFDLVKLMPTGMYGVIDYGVAVQLSNEDVGTTRFVSGPIHESADWERLPALKPDTGILGEQVEVVRRVRQELGPDTPVIQTIFSPLMLASKLVGGTERLKDALADGESSVLAGLDRLTQDTIAFGRACLDAGADGFFFATQLAAPAEMERQEYEKYGVPFDLRVTEALRDGAWCTLLHLHGLDPYFELADRYPVDAVNWHDRETTPSLSEALTLTSKTLVGGLERRGPLSRGTPESVTSEVRDAIAQTEGRRLIVAPGCVVPDAAPSANLMAARQAVIAGE